KEGIFFPGAVLAIGPKGSRSHTGDLESGPMLMSGIGGPWSRSKKTSAKRPPVLGDSKLGDLDKSLLALQVKNPKDPNIEEHFAVIADRLQELDDPRGKLMAMELECKQLRSQRDMTMFIEESMFEIKKEIVKDIYR